MYFGGKWSVIIGAGGGLLLVIVFAAGPNPQVIPGNVLAVGLMGLFASHLFLYPLQLAISLIIWRVVLVRPALSALVWPFSPVCWDEYVFLPLPGLLDVMAALYRCEPGRGRAALDQLAAHPFKRRLVDKARARLHAEDTQSSFQE
jgi:hypothetical protein